jgi:hydroxymethylpyrimidine/phosphomethylpyrimidine kinase
MHHNAPSPATALTIAGSDSCGGAGIQADLRTMTRWGVEGASVITAVTAQNTLAVSAVMVMEAKLVGAQLAAVFDDVPVRAIKTGMLANAEIILEVVKAVDAARRDHADLKLVVDPVMVATAGARLLDATAEAVMRDELLPRADLVTPNLPEAAALLGLAEPSAGEVMGAALLKLGCAAVLVKGGHGDQPQVEDVLMHQGLTEMQRFTHPRRPVHIHGTGCTLSAAITAALAQGLDLPDAVAAAIEWLHALIQQAHLPVRGKLAMLPVASGPAPHFKR